MPLFKGRDQNKKNTKGSKTADTNSPSPSIQETERELAVVTTNEPE